MSLTRPQLGPRHGRVLRRGLSGNLHLRRLCQSLDRHAHVFVRDLFAHARELAFSDLTLPGTDEAEGHLVLAECDFQL